MAKKDRGAPEKDKKQLALAEPTWLHGPILAAPRDEFAEGLHPLILQAFGMVEEDDLKKQKSRERSRFAGRPRSRMASVEKIDKMGEKLSKEEKPSRTKARKLKKALQHNP